MTRLEMLQKAFEFAIADILKEYSLSMPVEQISQNAATMTRISEDEILVSLGLMNPDDVEED
jgi:hypothetical protein